MRIGFVAQPIDTLRPPVEGGSLAIWIYQMARRCSARGHKTFVFANHGEAFATGSTRHEGVTYVYPPTAWNTAVNRLMRMCCNAAERAGHRPRVPEFAASWRDARYGAAAGHAARQFDCDVLHVMNYSQLLAPLRRAHPRAALCLHMGCEWLTQLDRATVESRLHCADLVVGCSDYITRSVAERFPAFADRCVTVPNAVDLVGEPERSTADRHQILFVGRLSPEKGLHVLVPAFRRVLEHFPQASLRLVGGRGSAPLEYLVGLSDDPLVAALATFYARPPGGLEGDDAYARWLEDAAGTELGRRIHLDGRVDHSAVGRAYEGAGVLVNPSLSEAFGMSLVEAMMHGVPVVASRVGGMSEIVQHGRTGLLVDAGDVGALAGALCEMLADPTRARAMGAAGRQRALSQYTWDHATDLLLAHDQRMTGIRSST